MVKSILQNSRLMFFLVVSAFVALFFTNGVPYIYADGFYYFHIAKSLVTQGSFVSTVKPEYYDYSAYAVAEYQGKFVEVVAPGTSLFLVPGLFAANLFRDPSQTIQTDYFLAFNGHTLAEGIAILITTAIVALASLVFIYKALLKFGYTRAVAMAATVAGFLSSYAVWYIFLEPAYTHIYEFFGISLLIYGLSGYFQFLEKKYLIIVGAALGILFLIRPPYALVAVIVGLAFLWSRNFLDLGRVILAALPALPIWLIYNFISYGSFFTTGYSQIRGENFTLQFNFLPILFSLERGWFIYSPVMLLGAVGLIAWWKRSSLLAFIFSGAVFSLVATYAFWGAWWGGYGFGQRFLLGITPIMIVGIAELLGRYKPVFLRRVVIFLVILATGWSLLLTITYRFTPVTKLREDDLGSMLAVDRYTPADMLNYQAKIIGESGSLQKYGEKLLQGANGGESLIVYLLGWSDRVVRLDGENTENITLRKIMPEIYSDKISRVNKVTGFIVWQDKVYALTINMQALPPETNILCDEVCAADNQEVTITETSSYPQTLNREDYRCYQLWPRRICIKNSSGNTFTGPKSNYSKQPQFVLLE